MEKGRRKLMNINKTKILGRGGFGYVYEGTFKRKHVAIKRIPKEWSDSSCEEKVQSKFRHLNVLKLLHFKVDDQFK